MTERQEKVPSFTDESKTRPVVQLARHLGVFDATMIGVGAMIGAGIFVLTGIAMGQAGPGATVAFMLNGIVTLFTALSYAELASAVPEAGGGYSFIKKVMPNSVAFASGWMLWFAYIIACSLYAKGFGSYFFEFSERYLPGIFKQVFHFLGDNLSVIILTLAIGLFFIYINIIGTHESSRAENIITIAKIVILSTFIIFGIKQIIVRPDVAVSNFKPMFPNGFGGVFAAMGLIFIAFEGYDLIATVSEEVKDPKRTIPRAILYSLGITIVIYLFVAIVCLGAVAPEEGMPTWKLLGKYKEVGIIRAARSFMPKFGVLLVLVGGVFATLSALNATIMASSRVAFAMGRDWMLPNILSRIHFSRKTPAIAIGLSGILFLVIAMFLPLKTIGTASSLLFLLTFSLVNAALIIYRYRNRPNLPPFRVPLFPLTPILGIITSAGLAFYQLFPEGLAWGLAAGWIFTGVFIYLVFFKRKVSIADVPKIVESPELLNLKKPKKYKILVPLANPDRVDTLMEFACNVAGISQGEVMVLNVITLPNITSYSEADPFLVDAQRALGRAQQIAIMKRIPFSSLLKIGRSAAIEIVQVARENKCDLILMGYMKEGEPLENSIFQNVISHQPCDIAILKGDMAMKGSFKRILIPIGGKDIHDTLKVRLIHSITKYEKSQVSLMIVVPPGSSKSYYKWAREAVERAAKIYNLIDFKLSVDENIDPVNEIISKSGEFDLLIMGMRKEPWLKSFFFGTISQQVAVQVKCPILLTKAFFPEKSGLKRLVKFSNKKEP